MVRYAICGYFFDFGSDLNVLIFVEAPVGVV